MHVLCNNPIYNKRLKTSQNFDKIMIYIYCSLILGGFIFVNIMLVSVELTQSSKVVEVFQRGDLQKSLRSLRELQPWSPAHLLAHFHRSASFFDKSHI